MKLVLDAGALIGIDRSDRRVAALIELGRRAGAELVTVAPVVAQAWRDGARQVPLARALLMLDVRSVTLDDGKRAGELVGSAGTADVVDALLALVVHPGDQVLTSDVTDVEVLLATRSVAATTIRV